MIFTQRILLACAAALAAFSAVAAPKLDLERTKPVPANQPVPIQDFFRPALWQRPKLNPSGTHIAGLVHTPADKYELLVHELKTQKSEAVSAEGSLDVYDFAWLDDRRFIFFLSDNRLYGLGLFAAEVGRPREAYPLMQYSGARLVGIPQNDRLFPLVWLRTLALEDQSDGGVVVVNSGVKTGRFVNLYAAAADHAAVMAANDSNRKHIVERYPAPGGGIAYRYLADAHGQLAFAFTSQEGALRLHRLADGRRWEPCSIDLETVDVLGAGNRADEVVARLPGDASQPRQLRFVDAATGVLGKMVLADEEYDVDGWSYRDPASRQIVGFNYTRDIHRTVWFDEGYRLVQKAVDDLFRGQVARIIGNNEAGTLFLVETFSDRHPIAYHWVDLQKRSAGLIKNTVPWLDPERMRPMQVLKFKTRDGRRLDAYVTLPPGASKEKPVPLVVLPHGGPWARDTWGFDREVQFLASRGYAVLQPNYRGSTGYNWMFPIEDQWEFRKMHDDVTDATRKMIATGLVDTNRIAIMGGSFGAYLALSGVAHEPSLYRCAVTIAGVFDWATVLQEHKYDQFTDGIYDRMRRRLGDPAKQADKFAEISPLRHVQNVRVPVFVAHGKEDRIAAVSESKRLVAELDRHNVPHEKFFVSGEGHGMAHLRNEVELYTRIEAFLARELAPPAGAAP